MDSSPGGPLVSGSVIIEPNANHILLFCHYKLLYMHVCMWYMCTYIWLHVRKRKERDSYLFYLPILGVVIVRGPFGVNDLHLNDCCPHEICSADEISLFYLDFWATAYIRRWDIKRKTMIAWILVSVLILLVLLSVTYVNSYYI